MVVAGAGPAGMHAALAAARAGAYVVLVDEAARAGGQYHRRAADVRGGRAGELEREIRGHPRIAY